MTNQAQSSTADVPASTQQTDRWMNNWWYTPAMRLVVGGTFFTGVMAFYIAVALDGEYGVFQFLAIGLIVLLPLERFMPRHRMPVVRPQLLTDFLHVILTSFIQIMPLFLLFGVLGGLRSQSLVALVQSQPQWLQIVEALFLTEFLIYWAHRITHQVPLLWKFHAVHHSVEYLDWIAGERRHPIDGMFTGIPLMIGGFDLVDLLVVGLFNGLWDMTIHANLSWRLKFMDRIWVTTEYHHWHHSQDREARDKNYAGALPVMDILFGTYYLPKDVHPGPYGIDTHMPDTYLGQLIQPFRPLESEEA